MVCGEGLILFGNKILHKCDLLETQDVLVVPPGVGNLSEHKVKPPIYTADNADGCLRTYLLVVPSQTKLYKAFFGAARSQISLLGNRSNSKASDYGDGKIA